MSLFKVRHFWSTNAEENDVFDQNSSLVTKINSETDYIITGSQSGILRIFNPECELDENGVLSDFTPNDLLVEKIFDSPVLQVGSGKLTSGCGENQIAVLHSKVLSVYSLVIKVGKTDHGKYEPLKKGGREEKMNEILRNQSFLQLSYEHKLRRPAYNFVVGPFGGIQNRDFICVQSLDGLLMFFEQESIGFYVALSDFLLPAPLDYVPDTDTFVTISSTWALVSISYKALSDSAIESDPIYSKPKVTFDWSFQLGEPAVDISVINSVGSLDSSSESWIIISIAEKKHKLFKNWTHMEKITDSSLVLSLLEVTNLIIGFCMLRQKFSHFSESKESWIAVLGERNYFCFNEKGQLRFMKRFEFCPICFRVYLLDDVLVSAIVSETSSLLIYKNTTLEWSSKLEFLPISINRIFLKNIKGALVLLKEDGRLEICYLGTEPTIFVAPPLSTKLIDFEKAEKELMELEDKLKKQGIIHLDGHSSVLRCVIDIDVPDNFQKEFRINVTAKPILSKSEASEFVNDKAQTDFVCPVIIEIKPQVTFQEIQIAIFVNRPLEVEPRQRFFSNFNEKTTINCYVFLNKLLNVPTLNLIVNVTVITNLGIPRYLYKEVVLPLNLVMETCPAEKESRHKITLSLNQKPLELESLFTEYKTENGTSNTIGLKSPTGDVVSVLLAKNSDRYRLQSNSLASMSLITEYVIDRLNKHYRTNANFKISLSSSLPASEVFELVREHFEVNQREQKLQSDLSQLSAQYRLIQKRLITKFKSKEPTSLKNLELLLNDTHGDILRITEQLQLELENLRVSQVNLTCALFLVNQLMKLLNTDRDFSNLTSSIFGVDVTDVEGQSWEDVTERNMCYLLKTALAKSDKDNQRALEPTISEIKDIKKFEEHFLKLLERITTRIEDKRDDTIFEVPTELSNVQEDEAEEQPSSSSISNNNIDHKDFTEDDAFYENHTVELSNVSRGLSTRQSLLTRRKQLNPNVGNSIGNHIHDPTQDDLV